MKHYETAFLIAPNLPEEETEELINQMAEIVSKKKGKMIDLDNWGKRKLAYPIEKFEEALYVFFYYSGEPVIPAELERRFKQTEAIIRYLTVRKEPKEEIQKKKAISKEEKKKTAPEEKKAKKPAKPKEKSASQKTEKEEE